MVRRAKRAQTKVGEGGCSNILRRTRCSGKGKVSEEGRVLARGGVEEYLYADADGG